MKNNNLLFPEDKGYFDDIKVIEVIDYYDGPKIYTFLTQTNDYYLAYFCEDSEKGTIWLNFPVNNYQLDKLLNDQISIKNFFRLCQIAFLVKRNPDGKVYQSKRYLFDNIPEEYIPDDDIYLEKNDATLTTKMVKHELLTFNIKEYSLITGDIM